MNIKKEYYFPNDDLDSDVIGHKFKHWTVLKYTRTINKGVRMYLCECDCDKHTQKEFSKRSLEHFTCANSCGCERKITYGKRRGQSSFNTYEIHGDITVVHDETNHEFKIDTEDLKLLEGKYWTVNKRKEVVNKSLTDGDIKLHRYLLNVLQDKTAIVDHINGNSTDNRRINLRVVTSIENSWNKNTYSKSKSGRIGVAWLKNTRQWLSCINVDGIEHYLGKFDENKLDLAIKARETAEKKYFGDKRRIENMGNELDYIITSESVCQMHPDVLVNLVCENIYNEIVKQDPYARCGIEGLWKSDNLIISGEVSTSATYDIEKIVQHVLRDVVVTNEYQHLKITNLIERQSPDIAMGVDAKNGEFGAGDNGFMVGYATNETDTYMPTAIYYAHKLTKAIDDYRKENINTINDYLLGDGKVQVSVRYKNLKVDSISEIVVCVQHRETTTNEWLNNTINRIIQQVFPSELLNQTIIKINPTGRFVLGSTYADCGVSGRKIVCDSYGADARVGGGNYNGKDNTKVDRSGAYYARYVAKNIVANGLADKCEIQVAYGIGIAKPVSIYVNCFGTNKVELDNIYKFIDENFDFRVSNIIKELDLLKPIYEQTACYGHFGREQYSWENIKLTK